jgi:hypothetical protein
MPAVAAYLRSADAGAEALGAYLDRWRCLAVAFAQARLASSRAPLGGGQAGAYCRHDPALPQSCQVAGASSGRSSAGGAQRWR